MSTKKTDNPYMMYPDEIQHHGVLGMKWGVHRYRTESGKLTEEGRKRFKKVSESSRMQKRDTRRAKAAYKTYSKLESRKAAGDAKKAHKALKRFDQETFNKYAKSARLHSVASNMANKKLKSINEGTLKAGRDFVVQRDNYVLSFGNAIKNINMGPSHVAGYSPIKLLFGVGAVTVDRVIERPTKKK